MNIDGKKGVSIFGIFLLGGLFFRYGIDILDGWSQHIQNVFVLKSSELQGKVEDVNMSTHKKWAVTNMEFPTETSDMSVIGFSAGDDYEEWDDDDE